MPTEEKTVEEQLKVLREEYKATADPVKRKLIEARGKLLKWSLEKSKPTAYDYAKKIFNNN